MGIRDRSHGARPVALVQRGEDGEVVAAGLQDLLRLQLPEIGELMHAPQCVLTPDGLQKEAVARP